MNWTTGKRAGTAKRQTINSLQKEFFAKRRHTVKDESDNLFIKSIRQNLNIPDSQEYSTKHPDQNDRQSMDLVRYLLYNLRLNYVPSGIYLLI
jgi:hypothetical protein